MDKRHQIHAAVSAASSPQTEREVPSHMDKLHQHQIKGTRAQSGTTKRVVCYGRSYSVILHKMFQWFQLIDLVSYMSSKSLNSFDLSQITLAFRPLAGSLVSMMASKPRHWLVIRKKMRSLREKNVSFIYGTIQQALRRIDELVIITYKRGGFPKMILQCILARRLVLEAIEREIYALASTIRRSGGRIGIPELIQSYQRPRQKLSYVRHGNTNALFSILKHLYMLLLESLASDPRHLVAAELVQIHCTCSVYRVLQQILQIIPYSNELFKVFGSVRSWHYIAFEPAQLNLPPKRFGIWKHGFMLWAGITDKKRPTMPPVFMHAELETLSISRLATRMIIQISKRQSRKMNGLGLHSTLLFKSDALSLTACDPQLLSQRRYDELTSSQGDILVKSPATDVARVSDEEQSHLSFEAVSNYTFLIQWSVSCRDRVYRLLLTPISWKCLHEFSWGYIYERCTSCFEQLPQYTCRLMRAITERPLEAGKTRVRWRCHCGKSFYDDYTELRPGAAQCLQISLDAFIRRKAGEQSSMNASPQTSAAERPTADPLRHRPNQAPNTALQQAMNSDNDLMQRLKTSSNVIEIRPDGSWLLVCAGQWRKPPMLCQYDVCSAKSDRDIFRDLKMSYDYMKGRLIQLISLRAVRGIRFVQFELHLRDFVDIRKVPDVPPDTRKDEYIYQRCDLIPPVGETLMTHFFQHPEHANDEQPIVFLRTPKKKKQRLVVCPQRGVSTGWGLQLVEGWVAGKLWLLALLFLVLGTIIFGICWSVLKKDLQGAFAVSAYTVALVGLVVGAVQAHIN